MAGAIDPRDGPGGQATGPRSPLPDGRALLLRRQAEEQLRAIWAKYPEPVPDDSRTLLEDLRVHQIELEMQNEELRRAQDSLEAARARYFDLYDLAPVGYLTLAQQGLIREVNLAAATLLGGPRSAVLGRPLSRFVHPEDQDTLYLCRQRLFETGEPQRCEVRLRRLDGDSVWVSLDANLGPDAEGGEPRWRLTLGDIGERKRAEEARAEEDRCKDRFIATLGHELRNPLAPIRSVADILRLTPTLDSEQDPASRRDPESPGRPCDPAGRRRARRGPHPPRHHPGDPASPSTCAWRRSVPPSRRARSWTSAGSGWTWRSPTPRRSSTAIGCVSPRRSSICSETPANSVRRGLRCP